MNILSKAIVEEFKRRQNERRAYTRKKFSYELGVSEGMLSGMISGRHGISPKRARDFLERLNLGETETNELVLFITAHFSRSKKARSVAREVLQSDGNYEDYDLISEETFSEIMNWYHLAIYELSKTSPFYADSDYISSRLGITKKQASDAVRKLKKFGIIQVTHGKIEPSKNHLEVIAKTSSQAVKNYHRQMLDKAKDSMDHADYLKREINSLLCAIDPVDIPRARKFIRKFWQEFDREISCDEPKELYALNVQFFPVSVEGKGAN